MTKEATIQRVRARGKRRRSAFLVLTLGGMLAASVAVAGTAQQAHAATTNKIFFASNRTTGTNVNNPTGDYEIFKMNPDGTSVKQLTTNKVDDVGPAHSPDGTKVAYISTGKQTSNPEGDYEVYVMDASDGRGKKNLTHNGTDVNEFYPIFSPGGKNIAYTSYGEQASNPEGDAEVYVMRAVDGTGKKNLTHNGVEVPGANPVDDSASEFSPDGTKIAFESYGEQASNPEGDSEVYRMNALDGSAKKNLTHNGDGVEDGRPRYSPDGAKIAYQTSGTQNSNAEGDQEIFRMNALDGTGQTNLSDNGDGVYDLFPEYSPGGKKIVYMSNGVQTSNPEGDYEVFRMSAVDGTNQKNLTNNGDGINDIVPFFSSDGQTVFYEAYGVQTSNPQGDREIYSLNTADRTNQKNLTDNGDSVQDFIYPD